MASLFSELAAQVRLATPVIVVNLGLMGLGVVDMAMAGNYATDAFAAVGLGHAYVWCVLPFGLGVLLALDPLVSQARGAKDSPAAARALLRGLLLAGVLTVPLAAALLLARPVLELLRQPPEVLDQAALYARLLSVGVLPMLVFVALRQSLQAMGRLRPVVLVALSANLLNAALDYALIFGAFGLPRLGVAGCALATVLSHVYMAAGLAFAARTALGPSLPPRRRDVLALGPLLRMLALGTPIGLQLLLEAGAFNAVTFLMGKFGIAEIAGHRTALTLASLSFMVPLGLSTAAAIRVGHDVGAGDMAGTRRAARVALLLGALVMLGFAGVFLSVPRLLASFFTDDPSVLAVAVSLLPMAAAFQLFDGLQVVASGVLRGVGEVRWPMLLNLVGYWVLGLPLGWWWAHRRGGGPQALWWALGGSLFFVALALLLRVRQRLSGLVVRLDLEDAPGPAAPVAAREPSV